MGHRNNDGRKTNNVLPQNPQQPHGDHENNCHRNKKPLELNHKNTLRKYNLEHETIINQKKRTN